MKIAVVSEWYTAGVGYAENFFPKALARLGHEVHVLTSDMQIYGSSPEYERVYQARFGPPRVQTGVSETEGFTLHRMAGRVGRLGITIPDLGEALARLAPDIVYCFEVACPTSATVAALRQRLGYRMFCESRLHSSIMPTPTGASARLRWALRLRLLRVPLVIENVETFYPIAPDVLHNITRYLGVPPERCQLSSLAVETQMFHPAAEPGERRDLRVRLGFGESELVCIYTGRLTPAKGPLLLARAVDSLHRRGVTHVRGLFVGEGDPDYVAQIAACAGCTIHPFVSPAELAAFYRSADVGVWPLQESTSQLDAMACGLPLLVNDSVDDPIRLGGIGRTFRKDDADDLASRIVELDDPATRADIGTRAAQRIADTCSWDALARRRAQDFARAPSA